jgi:hypothetical protein
MDKNREPRNKLMYSIGVIFDKIKENMCWTKESLTNKHYLENFNMHMQIIANRPPLTVIKNSSMDK